MARPFPGMQRSRRGNRTTQLTLVTVLYSRLNVCFHVWPPHKHPCQGFHTRDTRVTTMKFLKDRFSAKWRYNHTTSPNKATIDSCSDSSARQTQYGFKTSSWQWSGQPSLRCLTNCAINGSRLVHTLIFEDDTGESWRCFTSITSSAGSGVSSGTSDRGSRLKASAFLCWAVEQKERVYSYAASVRAQHCIRPDAWGGTA